MQIILTRAEQRKLKKIINKTKEILKIAIFSIGITTAFIISGYIESRYHIEAEVTEVDGYAYTVVDEAGYEWKFEDENKELHIGTRVRLRMNDYLTSNRLDDKIEKVKPIN
jgi:hypothetical protein